MGARSPCRRGAVADRAELAGPATVAERQPGAYWQISFMELASDFEARVGRPLPLPPQAKFVGGEMSLQEKAASCGWWSPYWRLLGTGEAHSPGWAGTGKQRR